MCLCKFGQIHSLVQVIECRKETTRTRTPTGSTPKAICPPFPSVWGDINTAKKVHILFMSKVFVTQSIHSYMKRKSIFIKCLFQASIEAKQRPDSRLVAQIRDGDDMIRDFRHYTAAASMPVVKWVGTYKLYVFIRKMHMHISS